MKVLLLNPPAHGRGYSREGRCQSEADAWLTPFPPTTFASIGGSVRERHGLRMLDCIGSGMTLKECLREAEAYGPEYVVANTSTPTIRSDLDALKAVKEATGARTIIYGEYATVFHEEILGGHPCVDYVVRSEPETPVMRILDGEPRSQGVSMRGWDGGLWNEPDLDRLPFPAYDLLPEYRFPLTGERWMFVRSGRGCPHRCIYCVMPYLGGRPRFHSAQYMVGQLKWLSRSLGISVWMLWDELATLDAQRMRSLCDGLVSHGLSLDCRWYCTTRVDRFNPDLAARMHEAGCRMVSFGIESGSQAVLDKTGKGISLSQSKSAVEAARKAGLRTIGHFIIGLPGETEETARKTVEFAKTLGLTFAQFYTATPFPASEFYGMALRNGWFKGDWDSVHQGGAALSYPGFPAERIMHWRRRAYREFYLRPRPLIEAAGMLSWRGAFSLPFNALKFIAWASR